MKIRLWHTKFCCMDQQYCYYKYIEFLNHWYELLCDMLPRPSGHYADTERADYWLQRCIFRKGQQRNGERKISGS